MSFEVSLEMILTKTRAGLVHRTIRLFGRLSVGNISRNFLVELGESLGVTICRRGFQHDTESLTFPTHTARDATKAAVIRYSAVSFHLVPLDVSVKF